MELSDITNAMRPVATEYWQTCRAIAEEARPLPEDERGDFVAQSVDGSEWVIYTYAAQAVLLISDNQDAYEAMFDDGARAEWSQMAYFAMEADVFDHIASLERLAAIV